MPPRSETTRVNPSAIRAAALLRWKLNSTWLVLGGAALGGILHAAHLIR